MEKIEASTDCSVLFIGDIVGKAGRLAVEELVPELMEQHKIDLVIANCENAAAGRGVTPKIAEFLFDCGIDILTSGNHIWDKQEIIPYVDTELRILRPANYPDSTPGRGYGVFNDNHGRQVGVVNLCGKLFMDSYENPYTSALNLIDVLKYKTNLIILDFHAEATSEKIAFGWYLDGKISALVGTHTHVQTADERVLPNGTAYITDVGMTGAMDSVIGMDREKSIKRFLTLMPQRLEPAEENIWLNGIIIDLDCESGKATGIRRINKPLKQQNMKF
jgi:2',3'-cyclic-nucleotide 2'-phosphodiesterase